jgi:hypothetical protein
VSRDVGRVKVNRGVARVASAPGRTTAPDQTTAMPRQPRPTPVFVDDSGRRRRRVRRVILGLGVLLLAAMTAVWLSQSAEPVRPAPVHTCMPPSAVQPTGCPGR